MPDQFAAMLRKLLETHEISGAELGRRLDGTDKSVVSRWKSGQDRPAPQTVIKIADIFGIDRMAMLRLAGWLPGEPDELDPEEVEAIALFRQLPSDRRLAAKYMLRGLAVEPVASPKRRGTGDANSLAERRRRLPKGAQSHELDEHNPPTITRSRFAKSVEAAFQGLLAVFALGLNRNSPRAAATV